MQGHCVLEQWAFVGASGVDCANQNKGGYFCAPVLAGMGGLVVESL